MSEINFPYPAAPGLRHLDPANNVEYIFDGVKWDVYIENSQLNQYWTRNDFTEELTPVFPNDYIDVVGMAFQRIKELP